MNDISPSNIYLIKAFLFKSEFAVKQFLHI